MERENVTDLREIKILAALIHSEQFILEYSLLNAPVGWAEDSVASVIRLCLTYWEKYSEAPGGHIWDMLLSEVKSGNISRSNAELLERIIAKADKEYESGINIVFLLDETRAFLKERSLEELSDKIDESLDVEDHEGAIEAIETFSVPDSNRGYVLPFVQHDVVREAFLQKSEPLFTFKGAFGELVNSFLTRDSFLAFMGPEKRGKTWWLFEMALRACFARNNVVVFQVGDMSEDQGLRRLYVRLAGKSNLEKYCGNILVPVLDCINNQNGTCPSMRRTNEVVLLDQDGIKPKWEDRPEDYRPCIACKRKCIPFPYATWYKSVVIDEPLNTSECAQMAGRLQSRMSGKELRMSTYPNSSVSVRDISHTLRYWARQGYTPDVVVVDYADILAPENGRLDYRHQENEKWKALRRVSQEFNCLVVTATQSDSASYDSEDMTLKNFSEDKRKFGHVTGMWALNQSPDEKREGVMRLGWLVLREGEFMHHKQVACLQSLKQGRPYLEGFWVDR